MSDQPLRAFIGRDPREFQAYDVCQRSLRERCTRPVYIEPLVQSMLRRAGLYTRQWRMDEGQRIDVLDGRPFSTEFTFTRFLVPALCQWQGVALFCDSDFLWRGDAARLFDEFDRRFAVQVVKHDYRPEETHKMRGQVQERYWRKNWSSLMLFNCSHPANKALTPDVVNTESGRWLHGFGWLADNDIGKLSRGWNYLEGHDHDQNPMAVHFTRGTPDMPGFSDCEYADEWRAA